MFFMMNKYSKAIAGLALGGTLLLGLKSIGSRDIPSEKQMPQTQLSVLNSEDVPNGPVYSDNVVPANMCSRYVRNAAEDLFGIKYPSADAWDIRDAKNVNEIAIKSKDDVLNLENQGILRKGMVLGLYNPKSKYNGVAKNDGAGYTHVAIYLGKENGKLYFADKFGKETRSKTSLEDLLSRGKLQPREILFLDNR